MWVNARRVPLGAVDHDGGGAIHDAGEAHARGGLGDGAELEEGPLTWLGLRLG